MEATQVTEMLYALRNPAGIPTYPIIFMGLGVLTFALHILFVQLMLGTSLITIIGSFSRDDKWRRLSAVMLEIAKVSVSVAIVIGVAPLLFVQVVYDPNWYASNVLSADYVIGFIFILILAYWAMYFYYFRNKVQNSPEPRSRWSMLISLALMLCVGFIMHSLTSQMLYPDQWREWYAPAGQMDYSGSSIHAYNLIRFGFFISLAIPVAGAMMITYRRFKMVREDADMAFLDWTAELGKTWMKVGSIISAVFFAGWMMTLPEKAGDFGTSIWAVLGFVMALFPAIWVTLRLKNNHHFCSYMPLAIMLVAGLVIATSREMLRFTILNDGFGYNFMDYKVVMDWYSTGLFFGTFAIVGGAVLAYMLTVAWQAGQTVGVYTPSKAVDRMGTIALWIIVLWVIQFFISGFMVWAQ